MQAYLITESGEVTALESDPVTGGTLAKLYPLLGEHVTTAERVTLAWGEVWVDENGYANGAAPNPRASRIARTPIVGRAVARVRKGRVLP